MKKWLGYLVAGIMAAIAVALISFAKTYSVLVDMVYPYTTRLIVTALAKITGGTGLCLWQLLLFLIVAAILGTLVWTLIKKGSVVRWLGWSLAVVSCLFLLNTVIFGLNKYSSPLADDVRLEINDYTVTELNEATLFFRDKANDLAKEITRKKNGKADTGSFKDLAKKAGKGFEVLTYDQAVSVFAGTTVPVKRLGFSIFYGGEFGHTVALTGEAAVNPGVPKVILPFAMCNEMARRMSVYSDADAAFAAYLAAAANPDPAFQYAAYLMAYNYCYQAMKDIPTDEAKAFAQEADSGVSDLLRADIKQANRFLGKPKAKNNRAKIPEKAKDEEAPLHFSEYNDVVDLLTNWYIKYYILPLQVEEELPFNPMDPTQVDLSGLVNAPKK